MAERQPVPLEAAPAMKRHRVLKVVLGWLVGMLLLVLLLRQAPWPDLQHLEQAVSVWGWGLAALLWSGSFVCRAARLRDEWRWKRPVGWAVAMRVVVLHNAAVLLLPMRSGELGYPWLVRRVFGSTWPEALRSLMWLRIQDAVVLGALACMLWPGLPEWWRMLSGAGLAAIFWMPTRFWRWLLTRRHPLISRLRPWMHRRSSAGGWWWCLGNWCLKVAVVTSLLHALTPSDLGLNWSGALRGALGGELAALIPVQGPAGLGTYEAAVWSVSGVAREHAGLLAATVLLVHGFCLLVSLGLALLWALLGRWPTEPVAQSKVSPHSTK